MTKWKTIKVKEDDAILIKALAQDMRTNGVGILSPELQKRLEDLSAGAVIGASIALLRDHLQLARAKDWVNKPSSQPSSDKRHRAKKGGKRG